MATPKRDALIFDDQVVEEFSQTVRETPSSEAFVSEFGIKTAFDALSEEHRAYDHLVHLIAETCYYEVTRAAGRVTDEEWWTDDQKTTRVRRVNYTRTAGRVTREYWIQSDASGNDIWSLEILYTYQGGRLVSAQYNHGAV